MNEKLVASTIIESLRRNGGFEIEELYKSAQKLHSDLDRRSFDEILMMLEIQGLVRVYSITRERRRIELARG